MAVTRIWSIKGNVGQVIDYAANKSKTDYSKFSDENALINSLHYAADKEKTNLENESKLLVEGINCDPDIAAEQMMNTKELYGKTGGIVAYHAYVSFKPNEVEPKEAQQIAMEIANKMWGKDYEIVVATHMNANCVHCHIVINSVSMTDGRKMNENKAMYQKFRQTSDEICLEHGLSVIEKPKGKRIPYNVYKAQQKGIKTKYDYMREDIDYAISRSLTDKQFFKIMTQKGYWFENETIGYRTDKHGVKLTNLGDDYTYDKIFDRIYFQNIMSANGRRREYLYANDYLKQHVFIYQFKGYEFREEKAIYRTSAEFDKMASDFSKLIAGGILIGSPVISLLFIALLFVGAITEKNNQNLHPFSPQMNYSAPRIEFMNKQIELAINEKLYDFSDVEKFIADNSIRIEELKSQRSKVYNQIRRCTEPEKKESLVALRDSLTSEISFIRDKVNTAKRIIKDRPDLEMKVQAEKELLREWYFPERERSKQKYYESR